MHLRFLENYRGPSWVGALATTGVLSIGAGTIYAIFAKPDLHNMSENGLIGTLIMMCALPGFFVASLIYLHRETLSLVASQSADSTPSASEQLRHAVSHLHRFFVPVVLAAIAYGAYQNIYVVEQVLEGRSYNGMDVGIFLGNCILWFFVGSLMAWRIPLSLELLKYGRQLSIDLYRLENSHPLANLAAKDVLIVAGAMSFMPLQALDAEFRWVNYQAGIIVGIPSALILLFMPLLGIRKNIQEHKERRLAEVSEKLHATDPSDLVSIELLSAHADRIKNLSNWPFNMRLATKIIGYAVIAPLAWVGAALVENLVDNLAG